MSKKHIVMLGAGGWSIALATVLWKNGHRVTLWSKLPQELEEIRKTRRRTSVLPEVDIPEGIQLSEDISVCGDADAVVMATAARFVRPTAQAAADVLPRSAIVISVAKGLDPDTQQTLSQVLGETIPQNPVVVLSGPSHAEEVARHVPTTLVSASRDSEASRLVADLFRNDSLRIYLSDDVVGVELGGVIKNVIAVAAGMVDGLGYGDNTKAALMTRAITEMARLGAAMGGRPQTFAGLTGVGDLIVTCTSMHSRNRRCGILIGQGVPVEEAIGQIGMTVEGVASASTVRTLAERAGVDMPIIRAIYGILYENLPPEQVVKGLMRRDMKSENEDVWF